MNKEKFCAFEAVRESGETNMYDTRAVIDLALENYETILTPEDVADIRENYGAYYQKYWAK